MNQPLNIKIIVGSTRQNRFGDKPAQWIADLASKREGITAEILDLRNYEMPFFNEPVSPSMITEPYANPAVKAWTAKIAEGDAFIMVTPEYNHATSAVLKNAIDYVNREWNRKAIAFVGYGTVGGARSVEQLRTVAAELQTVSIRTAVHIPMPWLLLDENGGLKPGALDPFVQNAEMMLDQLVWWASALKTARVQ